MRRKINYSLYKGKTINDLNIIDVIHTHDKYSYYFICKCKCGNEKKIRAICVVNNSIKSCGCKRTKWQKNDKFLQRVKQMGKNNRKHEEKCDYCGANNHFANGLCHNCYERLRRNGNLEYKRLGWSKNDRKSNKNN